MKYKKRINEADRRNGLLKCLIIIMKGKKEMAEQRGESKGVAESPSFHCFCFDSSLKQAGFCLGV